ncbi:MAG: AhpC/TSA family protein [Prevotella sp.]|nr:AhpC/TSA family protein [Prevotella sp.]
MRKPTFIFAALFLLLAVACNKNESKNSYELVGSAEGFTDGSVLQVVNMDGQVLDSIIIKDGKFSYTGKADTVTLYSLNVKSDEFNNVEFFSEPGTITVTLAKEPGKSKIAGTVSNDAWQELNNEVEPYYEKIQEIEKVVYSDTVLSKDAEWALNERYKQLANEITKRMEASAEKNIGNEMGFLLVTSFLDPTEKSELVSQLIEKMPEAFRQRPQILQIKQLIEAGKATEVGNKITDFSLGTPDGGEMNVMSEVQKNKITILDFWASWCGPCRNEMPFMKQLYAEFKPKGLGIVGISLDESAADWNRAISDLKLEWPQMSDLKGWESAAATAFQVRAIPHLVILDSEGKILQKGLRGEELKQFISQQLQ